MACCHDHDPLPTSSLSFCESMKVLECSGSSFQCCTWGWEGIRNCTGDDDVGDDDVGDDVGDVGDDCTGDDDVGDDDVGDDVGDVGDDCTGDDDVGDDCTGDDDGWLNLDNSY